MRSTTLSVYPLARMRVEVPAPARRAMIEREQPLLGQRGKKLDREERIAGGLLVHQLAPAGRHAPARSAAQSAMQLPQVFTGERRKHDLVHASLPPCGSPRACASADGWH